MSCLISLAGMAEQCDTLLSGVKKVYIANVADVANFNLVKTDDGELSAYTTSAITMQSGKTFAAYNVPAQTCSLSYELSADETKGLRSYTNTVVLHFNKLDARKHLEVAAISRGHLAVIVETNDGVKWVIGADSYAAASSSTASTGTSFDDGSYYEITLAARSRYMPVAVTMSDSEFAEIVTEPTI